MRGELKNELTVELVERGKQYVACRQICKPKLSVSFRNTSDALRTIETRRFHFRASPEAMDTSTRVNTSQRISISVKRN